MKNLKPKELEDLLISLRACENAKKWARKKSLAEAWSTCNQPDWMIWLASRYGSVSHKTIVNIACDCADPAMAFTSDPRPAECLATVRRWLKGEVAMDEVKAADSAADSAARAASLKFSANICRKYIQVSA